MTSSILSSRDRYESIFDFLSRNKPHHHNRMLLYYIILCLEIPSQHVSGSLLEVKRTADEGEDKISRAAVVLYLNLQYYHICFKFPNSSLPRATSRCYRTPLVMAEQNPLEAILKTCESIAKCAEAHLSNLFKCRLYRQKKKNQQTKLTTAPADALVHSAESTEIPPLLDATVQMLSIQAINPTVTDAKVIFNSISFVCSIVFMGKS